MIPFINLNQDSNLNRQIEKEIINVFRSRIYTLGPALTKFENDFAKFCNVGNAVGVASGTDALRLSLRVLGIGHGDKVLTVALTSPFTTVAIVEEGAIPIFCDVDSQTWTIDLEDCANKIDKYTRAIIPVHIYGNPCNMIKILAFAKKHKLAVIEDACQAHGAKIEDKVIGTFGDCAAFSFYPTKNLGAIGDGGMITTRNKKIAKTLRYLRHGGQTKRFWHKFSGANSRLDEIQAAILRIKLTKLAADNQMRKVLARRYEKRLSKLPLTFQQCFIGAEPAFHLYVIRTKKRNSLKKFLYERGISSDIYYPYPVYSQPAFKKYAVNPLKVTAQLTREILALPIYPSLTFKRQDFIIDAVYDFFGVNV